MYIYINVFINEVQEVKHANRFDRSENATNCLTPILPIVSVRVKLMTIISSCEFQSTVLNILDSNRCGHIYYTSPHLYHISWRFWPEVLFVFTTVESILSGFPLFFDFWSSPCNRFFLPGRMYSRYQFSYPLGLNSFLPCCCIDCT